MPSTRDTPPSLGFRLVALVAGTLFLLALSVGFRESSGGSFVVAALCVFAGAPIVMASLGYFCIKFVDHAGERRVRLATLLVLFIPAAVYLTAIRWLNDGVDGMNLNGSDWLFAAPWIVIVLVFTTLILLLYAEAIVWVALKLHRLVKKLVGRKDD